MKDTVWQWTEYHTATVDRIKKAVTDHPVLCYFDSQKEVTLQVDASDTGLEACVYFKKVNQ